MVSAAVLGGVKYLWRRRERSGCFGRNDTYQAHQQHAQFPAGFALHDSGSQGHGHFGKLAANRDRDSPEKSPLLTVMQRCL